MIEKNDFIEIELTATVKETDQILETTDAEIAKKYSIYSPEYKYGPKIVCIGQKQLLPSIEEEIKDIELNKEIEIILPPEKAFGKKDPKLLQLVSMSQFKKQRINPYPGLPVNIDNLMGIIRAVSPGRVIVDFNHPLASRHLLYKIKILRKVEDTKEKADSIVSKYNLEFSSELKNSTLEIKTNEEIDKRLNDDIAKRVIELVPIIKKVNFVKE